MEAICKRYWGSGCVPVSTTALVTLLDAYLISASSDCYLLPLLSGQTSFPGYPGRPNPGIPGFPGRPHPSIPVFPGRPNPGFPGHPGGVGFFCDGQLCRPPNSCEQLFCIKAPCHRSCVLPARGRWRWDHVPRVYSFACTTARVCFYPRRQSPFRTGGTGGGGDVTPGAFQHRSTRNNFW